MNSSQSGRVENVSNLLAKSPAINIPTKIIENKVCSQSFGALNIEGVNDKKLSAHNEFEDMSPSIANKIGSSGASSPNEFCQMSLGKVNLRPGRSLINPFNPSHVTIKLTSNRRRWIHTFPKGPTGLLIQQHHYQVSSVNVSDEEDSSDSLLGTEVDEYNRNRLRPTVDHRSRDSLCMDDPPMMNGSAQNSHGRTRTVSTNEGWPGTAGGVSVSSSIASTRGTCSPQKPPLYSQGVQPPPMPGLGPNNASLQISKHATLLWGATGEQEWRAEITTGVDWKSLTLPACLPLTTDYFPDKQSLQYDYEVAANYSRLPDIYRDIFLELVSQRLSQGFQLIMRPDELPNANQRQNSLMRARRSRAEEVIKEYKLSIGRVFHWLQLKDSSIDVTIYRPKHPYRPLELRYKFLFRSPYLSGYEISWVEFKTERLENYKWNSLDSYIFFKGDHRESILLEEFKYWRFRMMVLPDTKAETKKINESSSNSPCDIYSPMTLEEQQTTVENFLRFLEVIHRLKKLINSKKSWVPRERLGSTRLVERPRITRPENKGPERVRYESGNKDKEEMVRSHTDQEEELREESEMRKLNRNTNLTHVLEAMRDPSTGIPLISSNHIQLPSFSFLSYDATAWALKRFDDLHNHELTTEFFQKLIDENYIRHASGSKSKPFINGFYFYYFVQENEVNPMDSSAFETEWHEIAIKPLSCTPNYSLPCSNVETPSVQFDSQRPLFSSSDYTFSESNSFPSEEELYRAGYIEINGSTKSDRFEWGHLEYQTSYSPMEGFELVLQWMCATGPLVNDLVVTWQRKAVNQSLHLFPMPSDPFAKPFSFNSNPLRSPLVIHLNLECLENHCRNPLSILDPKTKSLRMYYFQKKVLENYGFLPYGTNEEGNWKPNFVHLTGNMIVMIGNSEGKHFRQKTPQDPKKTTFKPCFLWTFNYMLTRRWKSNTSGDEALGERILKDFKEFCNNANNRLKDCWETFSTISPQFVQSTQPFVDVAMQ